MRIKPRGKIYSINEGYESQWDDVIKKYVQSKKYPQVNFVFLIFFSNDVLNCVVFYFDLDWKSIWSPLCWIDGLY